MIWLTRYLEESIKGEDLVNTKKIAIKYNIQRSQYRNDFIEKIKNWGSSFFGQSSLGNTNQVGNKII